jgi:hypothetical protein
MKNISNNIFNKIKKISDDVKLQLKKKGVVLPVENKDGSINLGQYRIDKNIFGLYEISNRYNESIVKNLNLPQSAILIANGLALGNILDIQTIDLDRQYGNAVFKEQLHKKAAEKNNKKSLEYTDLMITKYGIARKTREYCFHKLNRSYRNLLQSI